MLLQPLASGLLTRTASRRLARFIPNPLLRVVAIAVAGYAIEQLVMKGSRKVRSTA